MPSKSFSVPTTGPLMGEQSAHRHGDQRSRLKFASNVSITSGDHPSGFSQKVR